MSGTVNESAILSCYCNSTFAQHYFLQDFANENLTLGGISYVGQNQESEGQVRFLNLLQHGSDFLGCCILLSKCVY